jgi:hypothetical protein
MKKLLMIMLLLISPYTQASEANVGDFGSNQQAETITTTTETTVNQEGMPVTTAVAPSTPTYQTDTCKGKIGEEALEYYIQNPKYVPDQPIVVNSTNCKRQRLRYDRTTKRHKYDYKCNNE